MNTCVCDEGVSLKGSHTFLASILFFFYSHGDSFQMTSYKTISTSTGADSRQFQNIESEFKMKTLQKHKMSVNVLLFLLLLACVNYFLKKCRCCFSNSFALTCNIVSLRFLPHPLSLLLSLLLFFSYLSVSFLMTWEAVANERQKVKWVWIFLTQPTIP